MYITPIPPARPPAAAVGGVPWGPLLYPEGAHGAPYFTQPGTQGPLLYPEGAHGAPLRSVSLPEKKFRSFAAKIFFRFTVEFGGPWGPLLLPSRGPRAPYFYPEGAHGAPYGWFSFGKNFSPAQPAKIFFRFTVEFWRFVFLYK